MAKDKFKDIDSKLDIIQKILIKSDKKEALVEEINELNISKLAQNIERERLNDEIRTLEEDNNRVRDTVKELSGLLNESIAAFTELKRESEAHTLILRAIGIRDWMTQFSKTRQISFENQLNSFLGLETCDSIDFSLDFTEAAEMLKEMQIWSKMQNCFDKENENEEDS